ncbi:MAG: UDP-3-O-(3-hydroxymyristoyl)glucosamine N-acyltransferase [Xanthobacteraceae bacterium]
MSAPINTRHRGGLTVAEIAALTHAELRRDADPQRRITGIAVLDHASPGDLVFLDSGKYAERAATSGAAACITLERLVAQVPARMGVLVSANPYAAFVEVARALYPDALRPSSLFEAAGVAAGASVHPTARVENGVTVDPGAVIGPRVEIGAQTTIGANAVIGPEVRIGRNCSIGANVSIMHALVGDRVIVHSGASLGQDGFGYHMAEGRHVKIPQVGRVVIQDDVEIGAGTTIDRGGILDTVVGEGTKIDNLVQVGHNVTIGRHCVLVSQVGIAGSSTLEDYVVLGAKVGVKDHVTIGEGAQIAAISNVGGNVPAGAKWGGTPAKPVRQWFREVLVVEELARAAEERAAGRKNA